MGHSEECIVGVPRMGSLPEKNILVKETLVRSALIYWAPLGSRDTVRRQTRHTSRIRDLMQTTALEVMTG